MNNSSTYGNDMKKVKKHVVWLDCGIETNHQLNQRLNNQQPNCKITEMPRNLGGSNKQKGRIYPLYWLCREENWS